MSADVHGSVDLPAMRRRLRRWWLRNGRAFPWRSADEPYSVFLAEFLLQKTQVAKAAIAYDRLIIAYPSLSDLAQASECDLVDIFRYLGLVKRASYLLRAAQQIVARHGGQIPRDASALRALPGLGEYSANAILCFGYGEAWPIVDSSVGRTLRRAFGLRSDREPWEDRATWDLAAAFLDPANAAQHNYALLDLAASVCLSRDPLCSQCPLNQFCHHASARRTMVKP